VYHFATWNDEGLGEYCLWMFPKFFQNENPDNTTSFPAVDAQVRFAVSSFPSKCYMVQPPLLGKGTLA